MQLTKEETVLYNAMSEDDKLKFISKKNEDINNKLYSMIIYFQLSIEAIDEIPNEIMGNKKVMPKIKAAKNALLVILEKNYKLANLKKEELGMFTELTGMVDELVKISIEDTKESVKRLIEHGISVAPKK